MKNPEPKISQSILEGLNQALEYTKGNTQHVKKRKVTIAPLPTYHASEIKQIRNSLQLTQKIFANVLGVSVKTVEAWEAGTNLPNGPTNRFLQLLKADPNLLENHHIFTDS